MFTQSEIQSRCETLLKDRYDTNISTGNDKLPIRIDFDDNREICYEVVPSDFPRPSDVASSVISACNRNSMIKFAVPAKRDGRIDYYANRIDNILSPPHLARVGKSSYTKLYKKNAYLSDDKKVPLVPQDSNSGEWYYRQKKQDLMYDNGKYSFTVQSPDRLVMPPKRDLEMYYDKENKNLRKSGYTKSIKLKTALRDSKRIPSPLYPYNIPRNRLQETIRNVEYLIIGKNITYERPYPRIRPLSVF